MNTTMNDTKLNANAFPPSMLLFSSSIISLRTPYPKNKPLNEDFQPGNFDVICGRGKSIFSHAGNQHFRQCIESNAPRYNQAKTKLDKSLIVIEIVDEIRQKSKIGGFVKAIKAKGQISKSWVEIGDSLAREKVGHALRDVIHGKHPTSSCSSPTSTIAAAYYEPQSIKCMRTMNKAAPTSTSLLAATAQQMIMQHRKSSLIIQDEDAASFLSLLTRMNNSKDETPEERRASEASFSLLLDHSFDFLNGGFDEQDEAEQLDALLASGEEEERDELKDDKITWV